MASSPPTAAVLNERLIARLRMRHLRLLSALAYSETLAEAALDVGVTQPAASQMLGEMERLLDTRLFERHRRGLRPTLAGMFLARQARQMLGSVRHTAEVLAAMREGQVHPLRIGAIPAAMAAVLQPLLPLLRSRLSGLELHIEEGVPDHVKAELRNGNFQVGLYRQPADALGPAWVVEDLVADEIVIVGAAHHTLAQRKSVAMSALATIPWLLPQGQHASADAFTRACHQAGFTPRRSPLQCMSLDLLATLTADGCTLAAAPRSLVAALLRRAEVTQITLREPIELPPLSAVYRAEESHPALQSLLAVLRTVR